MPNSDLADFLSIDNVQLAPEGTPVDQNDDFLTLIPEGDAGKQWLFAGFVDQYEQLGIIETAFSDIEELPVASGRGFTDGTLRKVPNDSIFFYQPNPDRTSGVVTMNNDIVDALITTFDLRENQPFTFVIPTEGFTLNIDNDLTKNGAYIVRDDITFNPQECDDSNIVEGIFITNGIFTADPIRNDDPAANQRCGGGSLKVDGILVGQGVDEDFANARRSTLSARPIDETTPGLFDDSLPGQARELFNTCLLPNLMNYVNGWPISSTNNDPDPKFARPVTLGKAVDGPYDYVDSLLSPNLTVPQLLNGEGEQIGKVNICTVATFDRGRNWINESLENPGARYCQSGQIGNPDLGECTRHETLLDDALGRTFEVTVQGQVVGEASLSDYLLSENEMRTYATTTVNAHIRHTLRQTSQEAIAEELSGGETTYPKDIFSGSVANSFVCLNNDVPGCIEIEYLAEEQTQTGEPGQLIIKNQPVYNPARNVARRMTLQQIFGETNNGPTTFANIRNAYSEFDEIPAADQINVTVPNGGILGLFYTNIDFNDPLVSYYINLLGTSPFGFANAIQTYLDFAWINDKRNNLQGQNIQRSATIFEGSAVLLELNASKWTQLSPGLKAYLDSTLVER